MKKKVVKRLIITFVFIFVIVLLYAYASMVFMPKDETDLGGPKYYAYANFKKEDKNTIDAVFFGNSDVYSGVSPIEIYKQTGVTSYVRSGAKESAKVVRQIMKETLKYQSPKLYIIDADCLFYPNKTFIGSNVQRLLPFGVLFAYHARWKELEFKDFYTLPKAHKSKLKGYIYNDNIYDYTPPENYMQDVNAKPEEISKSTLKDFDKIVKLCKKNNITLCLMCLPTPSSWNNAKSNAISELAQKYSLDFLDLNLPQADYSIDFEKCFNDNGNHMNIYGATQTSKYLAKYYTDLMKNSDNPLTDYRDNEKYAEWNNLVEEYDNMLSEKAINL